MTGKSAAGDLVVITAKRLDSEDSEEATIQVDVPRTEAEQQAQLIDLVHARYPDAEFRSFANEAASFLAHKVLVVAVYRRSSDSQAGDGSADDGSQQQLFAA